MRISRPFWGVFGRDAEYCSSGGIHLNWNWALNALSSWRWWVNNVVAHIIQWKFCHIFGFQRSILLLHMFPSSHLDLEWSVVASPPFFTSNIFDIVPQKLFLLYVLFPFALTRWVFLLCEGLPRESIKPPLRVVVTSIAVIAVRVVVVPQSCNETSDISVFMGMWGLLLAPPA